MDLSTFLQRAPSWQPAPLMGEAYTAADYVVLDLSRESKLLEGWPIGDQQDLGRRIGAQLQAKGAQIGWGGYMENRSLYEAYAHFGDATAARSLHLGIDLWAPVGHPVFAPLDGVIHSYAYNSGANNYGATIILEHLVDNDRFYTLYGHLSLRDLDGLAVGQPITKGQRLCHIGPEGENGGWWPHLHFQVILDIGHNQGDYPGVALPEEQEEWMEKCPDPGLLLAFE